MFFDIASLVVSVLNLVVDAFGIIYRYIQDKKQAAATSNSDGNVTEK